MRIDPIGFAVFIALNALLIWCLSAMKREADRMRRELMKRDRLGMDARNVAFLWVRAQRLRSSNMLNRETANAMDRMARTVRHLDGDVMHPPRATCPARHTACDGTCAECPVAKMQED